MRVFVDGMALIRIESDQYIWKIELNDNHVRWLKNEGFNQFFTTDHPIRLHQDDTILINDVDYPLEIGIVTLTKPFEERFRYNGPLGYQYHPHETTFRLFTPVAKEVILMLDGTAYPMTYQEPIWSYTIHEDCHMKPYHFRVRLVDTFKDVRDPYTKASSTKESYVIDFDRLLPIEPTPIRLKHYVDAVIYEGHVRDLSIGLDVPSKGLFDGLIERSDVLKGSVLDYVKKLGMTHLQLLPVFDFEGVDDLDKKALYNWGYNPSQFFTVEGWYAKNPDDPVDRIEAFRRVINEAHRHGLGINMDVVYNHVYQHMTFPYDHLVPGYFYRHDQKHKMTDASFCGNDIETRNYMVRKLIIDSLIHFVDQYQIDGFRFDLMGLLDLDTMHEIESVLRKKHPWIMLYGEGWNMLTEVPTKQRSNMHNQALFPTYGQFNDFFRNTIKGELHGAGLGFSMGNKGLINKAMEAIIGSPHLFSSPNQSINYVECHDNMTYYDKMLLSCGFEQPAFKDCQDFANHLIAIAQGIPFYHAGQEFYRSKKGVENSYNSPDEINQIHWHPNIEAVKKLRRLLRLRKQHKLYRQTSYGNNASIEKIGDILLYKLENDKEILLHYLKQKAEIECLPLHEGTLIFPSQKAITKDACLYVDKPGIYIIQIRK